MQFDRCTVVLLLTPEDPPKLDPGEEVSLWDAHLDHLARLHEAGHLLAAGPTVGPPGRKFRGVCIFRGGPEEARALEEQDPAIRAGVFALEVMPWMVPGGAMHFAPTRFPHSSAEAESD